MHSSTLTGRYPGLLGLPVDVLAYIVSFLSSSELAQMLSLCREWKDILLTIPSLWRRLDVDFAEYATQRTVPLRKIVGYSKNLPLELHLRGIGFTYADAVLSLLEDTMHRVRDLTLWFDTGTGEHDVCSCSGTLLYSLCYVPAPMLTRLTLGRNGPKCVLEIPYGIFDCSAPKLKTLVLDAGVWLNKTSPTPAFENVEVLTACPNAWDVTVPLQLLPRLDVMHFCGNYNPIDEDVPFGLPDAPRPPNWRPFSTLGLHINDLYAGTVEDPIFLLEEVLAIVDGVLREGVKHVILRADDAVLAFLLGTIESYPPPRKLSLTCGGYDPGLDFARRRRTAFSLDMVNSAGKTITVSRTVNATASNIEEMEFMEGHLWGAMNPSLFSMLTELCLCESMIMPLASKFIVPMPTPKLTTLVVYIKPSSQRVFAQLLGSGGTRPFIVAPKLRTLRLGVLPSWPLYSSGGSMIEDVRSQIVVGEAYEVSALSVNAFINTQLVLDSEQRPLHEVTLDPRVVFFEGFRSPEVNVLRTATRNLRYSQDET